MEVTELFTDGKKILEKNIIIATPLVAVGIITSILGLVMMGTIGAGPDMMGAGGRIPNAFSLGAVIGTSLFLVIMNGILNIIAIGATYVMASEAIAGRPDLNSSLARALERFGNLLVTSILMGMIVFLGTLLLFLPGLVAAYLLMFALLMVMLDGCGPLDALKGSFELVKSHIGETLVFVALALAVIFAAGLLGSLLGKIPVLGWVILQPLVSGMAMAYLNTVLVLLYRELA